MNDYGEEIRCAVDGDRLTVSHDWEGFPGQAFGGFAAAAVLVAAASETEKPRPLSLFARFKRPIPVGKPVAVALRAERRGRSVDTMAAKLLDGDRELASFTAALGQKGESPLRSQAVPVMTPLRQPAPVWRFLEEIGIEPPPIMRRVGYRGEPPEAGLPNVDGLEWHLRNQWPATSSNDLAVRAAMAVMPIDVFVGPATIHANEVDINAPWPVLMPSLDLTAWFYAPESPPVDADEESPTGWLNTRTSVPVTNAAYAVGRTQVWSGDRFVAEGMSQVALIPAPPAG
jgi:acyl-CoA thioesterase